MNQRSKRSSERKRNSFVSIATGSFNTLRRTTGKQEGEIQVPVVKETGLAKASPSFKSIKPTELPSSNKQKKVLAEAEVKKEVKKEVEKQSRGKATGDIKDTENK